jgi:hypothetical protein
MRWNIKLESGAFGTNFRDRRHQGRHRCPPISGDATHVGVTNLISGEPEMASVEHLCTDTAAGNL